MIPLRAPGYEHASEHLADLAALVDLRLRRLQAVRAALPNRAYVTDDDRRRIARDQPQIAELDAQIEDLRAAVLARATFAHRMGVELPLIVLRDRFGLDPIDVDVIASLITIERGAAFNPYVSQTERNEPLQADVAFLVALIADGDKIRPEEVRLRLTPDAPLVSGGLVELAAGPGWVPDAPLVYKRVRLAERVLDYVEGLTEPSHSVLGTCARFVEAPAPASELLLPERALVDEVARALARTDQIVELLGAPGVGRKSVAGAAARSLGRPVLVVRLPDIAVDARIVSDTLRPLVREARLQDAVLVLDGADTFGDGVGQEWIHGHLIAELRRVPTPMAVIGERSPGWAQRLGRVPMRFTVPFPSADVQRRLWVRHLPPQLRLAPGTKLDQVATRYSASCASIREAAEELGRLDHVHQRGGLVTEDHIIDVIRMRLAHRLGSLATVVRTTLEWGDVILPDDVLAPVFEFLNYAAHRAQVFKEWGFDRKLPYGRGLSALFAGPPGTGKTMICSLLAKELGLELYRIDLSQVVNKYIGETEKNLGRVFDEAARGQVMLLFDEADSLFAKRTEVKSSHDRYANLEVNYLLQRMESHEGVVVMTTNSETAIDPAFRRRIRFRIRFPAPDEHQRKLLWEGMVPKEAQLAGDVDFGVLAQRFPLAGGNIMNALVRAATAAAADGGPIHHRHLLRAAELEYGEMGFLA
jgi:hypothetical protein